MATRRKVRKPRWNYRKPRGNKMARVWSPQEITFLRKYYRFHDTTWVARQLGRTVYSVRYKASNLNIRKSNPSNWKTPPKGTMFFGTKNMTIGRRYNRSRKPTRYGRTRRNNRRTKW